MGSGDLSDDRDWLDLEPVSDEGHRSPPTASKSSAGDLQPRPSQSVADHTQGSRTADERKASQNDNNPSPAAANEVAANHAANQTPKNQRPPKSDAKSPKLTDSTIHPDEQIVDEELPSLAPEENRKGSSFANDLFASINLNDLEPTKPTGNSSKPEPKSTDQTHSRRKAPVEAVTDTHDAEYRILCRVCGTPQYVTQRKTGKSIRCPDCHSEFVVPPPPSTWDPKAAKSKAGSGKHVNDDLRVAAAEETAGPTPEPQRLAAQEYLRKAEEDSLDKHLDTVYANGDFDSQEFFRRNFSVFSDPTVWFHAVPLGVVSGLAFAVYIGMGKNAFGVTLPALALTALGFILGGLVLFAVFMCGYALVDAAANRRKRVQHWPLFEAGLGFSNGAPVIAASLLAIAPGTVLALILSTISGGGILGLIPLLLSFWAILPVILLSMLNNESATNPFSPKVFASISQGSEEWGAYYLKTGIILFFTFVTLAAGATNITFAVIAGCLVPLAFFYVYYQLGLLGSGITDWLDVQIGGDFEAQDQASVKPPTAPG